MIRRWLGSAWRDRPLPLHPFLVAAYPVLFLYGENLGELKPMDIAAPLAAILVATLAVLVVGAIVMRDARRAALVVSALVVTLLVYGHIAGLLRPVGVRPSLQQIAWAIFLTFVLAVAIRVGSARLAGMTRTLNLVTAVLVVFALLTIVPEEFGRIARGTTDGAIAGATEGTTEGSTIPRSGDPGRDIYYLVLDRYGSASSLELEYGIDDRPFLERLRARGFEIVSDSHANYVKTSLSLAATLNLDYLDDLAAAQDPASNDHGPLFERISDHAVGRFLLDQGYRYIHVGSNFGPTRMSPLADRNLRFRSPPDFDAALYDASALPAIAQRLGISLADPDRERQYDVGRFQLDALDELVSEPGPTFVFAHLLLPHPPYVFASDGSFVTDEAEARRSVEEGYAQQLEYLQSRIDALVDRLLARPEAERPIIILQGDEGPYPPGYDLDNVGYDWTTATSDELEIKFGILNAMYLPGGAAPELPATLSAVNTFRLVFDRYFDAALPLLPDRSFTSSSRRRPYDLTEITDRLPAPDAGG